MTFYLPKPGPWALDPALTERPEFWKDATVVPFWERRGIPKRYGKAGFGAITASVGVEGTDWSWANTAQGNALKILTVGTSFKVAADSAMFPSLDRGTFLTVITPQDTTNRASWSFATSENTPFTNEVLAHSPFSDGVIYWDFGGFASPNRVSWSGYSKTGLPLSIFAFRAGTNGMAIFYNGTKVATSSTAVTKTRAAPTDAVYLLSTDVTANRADLIYYQFFAGINAEWTDAQIYEWMRDPFVMLRPRGLSLIIVTQPVVYAAVGTASGTSSMAAIAPEQVARPDGDYSVGDWTTESGATSNLYQSIDETTASDTDYIRSAEGPADSTTTISLSDVTDIPGVGGGRVTVRYYKEGTETINLTVYLMEGATEIASWTLSNISDSVVQFDNIISLAQVASIVDRTNLQVKLKKSVS